MIIFRYLSRQILLSTFAISSILLVVAVLGRFLKYLAQAAKGELDPGVLFLLMSYRLPEFIQLILPIALILGILFAYGRMYAESEMTVLIACGLSKRRLLAYTLAPACMVAIIEGGLSLQLTPWGLHNSEILLQQQKEMTEFDIAIPGIFQNYANGQRTSYIKGKTESQMLEVFTHDGDNDRVIFSETATPSLQDDGGRLMVWGEGVIYEGIPGEANFTVTQFSEYGLRAQEEESELELELEEKALTSKQLLSSDLLSHQAELQWRISLIILIPVLTFLAVPLSRVNPRQGRFARIFPAFLLCIGYYGLLLAARDIMVKGNTSAALGLWWVHGVFLLLGVIIFMDKYKLFFRKKSRGRTASPIND